MIRKQLNGELKHKPTLRCQILRTSGEQAAFKSVGSVVEQSIREKKCNLNCAVH